MKRLLSFFKKPIYEFKYVTIHDTYIKTQPIEYQKQGWEVVAVSEPKHNPSSGFSAYFTLKRLVK